MSTEIPSPSKGNAHISKHIAGQLIAPFVGTIVGIFSNANIQKAGVVQWATSALAAAILIETQHRVFKSLQQRIGEIHSSVVAILAPSAVTTGMSHVSHSIAGTDAKTAATVVGVLSLLGYTSLQCYQLLSDRNKKGTRDDNE